jgi:hypothetical protein
MVRLKQGQDEMESDAVVTDYSSSVLISRNLVESTNAEIVALGQEKVSVLTKIKEFRKSINFMKWEHEFLQMQVRVSAWVAVCACVVASCGAAVLTSRGVVDWYRRNTRRSTTPTCTCCA